MNYLLDTCALIWLGEAELDQLTPQGLQVVQSTSPEILKFVSYASFWEICLKTAAEKLVLKYDDPLQWFIEVTSTYHIQPLEMTLLVLNSACQLPKLHKDPFDRLLVAQALEYDCTILTPDHFIQQYQVPTLW